MPEGEKNWGCQLLRIGRICPPPPEPGTGSTELTNIDHLGYGITVKGCVISSTGPSSTAILTHSNTVFMGLAQWSVAGQ